MVADAALRKCSVVTGGQGVMSLGAAIFPVPTQVEVTRQLARPGPDSIVMVNS
jgi:hypothetical protein